MKRVILVLGMSALLSTVWLSAQTNNNATGQPAPQGRGVYIDANKNGICDNYEARHANISSKRGQGNNQSAYGRGRGGTQRGRNFVDANKNGICDNYENRTNPAAPQK